MDQKVVETKEVNNGTAPPQQVVKTTTVGAAVAEEHPQKAYEKKKVIFRAYQIIWYIVGFIEILLIFRVVLKALAANPGSSFVNLIYAVSDPFALPFSGIFGVTVTQGAVFEWSTLIAGVVYAIVGFGLVQLFQLIKPANPKEVEQTVDNQ